MPTITEFNPAEAGLRVAQTPIQRRKRRPSAKAKDKPPFADAVWFSFENGKPLETEVPTRAVEDTVRALKRAARFLDRSKDFEVRVQIGVEAVMGDDGQPVKPARSTVKFLGHEPFRLGRRVAKENAEALASARPVPARRRTVAATRSTTL